MRAGCVVTGTDWLALTQLEACCGRKSSYDCEPGAGFFALDCLGEVLMADTAWAGVLDMGCQVF